MKRFRLKSGKAASIILAAVLLFLTLGQSVSADMPYESYNFNYYGEEVLQPYTYLYTGSLTATEFGTSLSYPNDMEIVDGLIYVADTGNSRILILDMSGAVQMEITCADGDDDPLSSPQ